ncbi:MAG: hypothetical protein AAF267_02855 [Deinococcota bacterium]
MSQQKPPSLLSIRLQGHLGADWTTWFEDFTITLDPDGTTLLTGDVTDQAALYGILRKVRDLGLPLLVVRYGCADRDTKSGG